MSDFSKRWKPGHDDRELVALKAGVDRDTLDRVLDALFGVVFSRLETTIIGHAKFTWTPVRGRTPTGADFVSRRLRVVPSRYADIPAKAVPVLGRIGMGTEVCA